MQEGFCVLTTTKQMNSNMNISGKYRDQPSLIKTLQRSRKAGMENKVGKGERVESPLNTQRKSKSVNR